MYEDTARCNAVIFSTQQTYMSHNIVREIKLHSDD